MPTIILGIILLTVSAAGSTASFFLLNEKKRIRAACFALCVFLAFMAVGLIVVTIYFGWAVANQPADDLSGDGNSIVVADRLTHRCCTEILRTGEDLSVCFSPSGNGNSYAT